MAGIVDVMPLAMTGFGWALIGVAGFILLIFLLIVANFFGLWLQAYMSHAGVSMADLIGMKLRKVDLRVVVLSKIRAAQAGLRYRRAWSQKELEMAQKTDPRHYQELQNRLVSGEDEGSYWEVRDLYTRDLEQHYLAGGRIPNVITALIAADRANIDLPWNTSCAIDLAGRDILDAVQTSVNPKVIDCPSGSAGKGTIDAVAQDGIQLRAKARVTVRANIERLVGGATEETIIARVGEGIVTTIGSAISHKAVLENPDLISKSVLAKGLDSGTAFDILSIDIADVDVGENIGAKLQADQAEADKRRFQAEAEKRRAMAIAREQEMKASVQENRAKVVLAEAEIPLAIAESFRSGNLGIMDYYRLRNIQADTSMRQSLGGSEKSGPAPTT